MRGNCEIGTAAREAKCVRLVRFEHTVGFLKFTSGCLVKVGYVAEQAHLQGRVRAKEEKIAEYYIPRDHTFFSLLRLHDYHSSLPYLRCWPYPGSPHLPRHRTSSSKLVLPISPKKLYPLCLQS